MTVPRTLKERYDSFRRKLYKDRDAPPPQVEQFIRLTFYVGASHVNELMTSEIATLPEDVGVIMVERLQEELRQFARDECVRFGIDWKDFMEKKF